MCSFKPPFDQSRSPQQWFDSAMGAISSKAFRVGTRLDDVAWDHSEACKLAVAGAGPNITLLDFGKV